MGFQESKTRITNYIRISLKPDLIAAVTVALIAIPQAMAYAAIAGVNPVYGLYSAIIPAIVASIFGSSNHVVTGPTNTIALATSGVLIAISGYDNYVEFVFALAILSGLFKLFLGLFQMGILIRYVSNSVLTGFLTGAAVLIIFNQLPQILGIQVSSGHNVIGIYKAIQGSLQDFNLLVLLIGLFGVLILLAGKVLIPRFPSALFVLVIFSALVAEFQLQDRGVQVIGEMSRIGISELHFHLPDIILNKIDLGVLFTGAGAVALLSLLEAVSVAKAISFQTGQRIDANREFIGQGLASIAGGLFQGIPTSGSLTRSAINFSGGAVTRAAGGFSGLIVLLGLALFKGWLGYIPKVVLAGIVVVSAMHMIDFNHIKLTWRGRTVSKIVMTATFLSVLFLPLLISIYLGVGLSILFYLVESSHLYLTYLVENGNGKFVEKDIDEVWEIKPARLVVNVEGPLYFAAVEDLEIQVTKLINLGIGVIILRLRRMHLMASSGITTLEKLIKMAKESGVEIRLAGVSDEVLKTLTKCGIDHDIQLDHIFMATDIPYESTRKALL